MLYDDISQADLRVLMMLGKRIKQLREEKDLSQQKLADILGVSQQAVAKWESSKSEPDSAMLMRISNLFNISMDYLFGKTNIRNYNDIETIAAHHDGDEWTEEELEEIERFKEFVRMKRQQKDKK